MSISTLCCRVLPSIQPLGLSLHNINGWARPACVVFCFMLHSGCVSVWLYDLPIRVRSYRQQRTAWRKCTRYAIAIAIGMQYVRARFPCACLCGCLHSINYRTGRRRRRVHANKQNIINQLHRRRRRRRRFRELQVRGAQHQQQPHAGTHTSAQRERYNIYSNTCGACDTYP